MRHLPLFLSFLLGCAAHTDPPAPAQVHTDPECTEHTEAVNSTPVYEQGVITVAWAITVDGGPIYLARGSNGIAWFLDLPQGAVLTALAVVIDGVTCDTMPYQNPSVFLWAQSPIAPGNDRQLAAVIDPAASLAEYDPPHPVTIPLDVTVDRQYLYTVEVLGAESTCATGIYTPQVRFRTCQ